MSSGRLATKYGKAFAEDLGITGDFGLKGVDNVTARNAFHKFMTNPDNYKTSTYMNITHQLYHWHSLADIRSLEYWLDCGIRPSKYHVDFIVQGYKNGSTIPKYKSEILEYKL